MDIRVNLGKEIVKDLGRNKFQLLLAIAIVATAMTTLVITQETRLLTITQNELQDERDKLEIEWRHLLLEQNALAEHSRVSDIAKSKLQMDRPSPLKEKIINQP